VPYPPRPQLRPRPEFAGTARTGTTAAGDVQARLEAFIVEQYTAGRSLRELAELVDRTQTAVRRVLDKHQVAHRSPSAARLQAQTGLAIATAEQAATTAHVGVDEHPSRS
jgi:hypothetical protein